MVLILLCLRRLPAFWTQIGANTMQHHNSVFHQITNHIPWSVFDRLVGKHCSDFRVRRLNSKSHLMALLFGQLSGARSLREIETGLHSQKSGLYHLGMRCAARSTLSDANAVRDSALFGSLFAHMATTASRNARRKLGVGWQDSIRILDASCFRLSDLCADWARFSDAHSGVKLHVCYDPVSNLPLEAQISLENVNDITPAKELQIVANTTYVFDLAYYDFGWWARLDRHGCRFVTRLKTHTRLHNPHQRCVSGSGDILSDITGYLRKQRNTGTPTGAMENQLREITVRISTGRIIRIVTNDLNAPAHEIADLYKQRWQIELFFKWIKQNLKIKTFLGRSENAVRIQLFIALIAYLILHKAHATQPAAISIRTLSRLVRLNLFHKRSINTLNKPHKPPPKHPNQYVLDLSTC